MLNKITLIGGDLRSVKLAQMLEKDGNIITTFGFEKSDEIIENTNIKKAQNIEEAIENSEIIIAPIPFSRNGEEIIGAFSEDKIKIEDLIKNKHSKIIMAGNISEEIVSKLEKNYEKVYDLMKMEELVVLNTIATAEGTIDAVITNTDKIIQGSKVLVLGFGRVAKIVALKFRVLAAIVTCAARKTSDLAWIKAYGYTAKNINNIKESLGDYDVIINTVPDMIINEPELKAVRKDALLVDLASNPGGIDRKVAKNLNLKLIWALSLPGKTAPVTSAEFIKETIYNIIDK